MFKGIIVKGKILDEVSRSEKNIRVSKDVFEQIERKIVMMLNEGIKRAKDNNRSTLMGRDI